MTQKTSKPDFPNGVPEVATGERQRSFLGRHPSLAFLVFAVSPLPSLALLAILAVLLGFGVSRLVGLIDDGGTHFGTAARTLLPTLLAVVTIVIPAAVLTLVYFAAAKRFGVGKKWPLASWLVLAALAGLTFCDLSLSEMPGQSQLTFGLGVSYGWHLLQPLLPLAVGIWLWHRNHDRGQLQPAA